jgi:alpha-D-ribose 1-methylphosphonate 5-triphosphate diphosphatase PhnM
MAQTARGRTVYDFRAAWLDRLVTEYGGNEQFAEAAGRNSKHVSAMRRGHKQMGAKVARDIEHHLMQRRGSKVWPGMMDSDPDTQPRVEEPRPTYQVQVPSVAPSQALSDDALTMAIQTVIELLTLRRGTLPADKQARFIRLVYDMAVNGVPKAQIVPLLREAIANTPEVDTP